MMRQQATMMRQHDQRTAAEAFVVGKSMITTIQVAALADLELAACVLAIAGYVVTSARESEHIVRGGQEHRSLH
jgi:hypothetical protein